jgi:hypothetical protein
MQILGNQSVETRADYRGAGKSLIPNMREKKCKVAEAGAFTRR